LKAWINLHSKGDDGFTALHYASFHGNLSMMKILISYGANIEAVNRMGINMLHVAAQGDQPISLAFFRKKGLSINSTDKR
jgi:ankyrin repeat protein